MGGAILSTDENSDMTLGVGSKCSIEDGMSSLTAEQYGITSGILALSILSQEFGKPKNRLRVIFWIDNEEALNRAKNANLQAVQLKEFDVSDYAVKTIMQSTINTVQRYFNIQFNKVKSHQEGPYELLPFEAILNNKADDLANWLKNCVYGPSPVLDSKIIPGMCLLTENEVPIKDIKSHIYMKVNGSTTKHYLKEKTDGMMQHSIQLTGGE